MDMENRLVVAKREGEGGMDWESGVVGENYCIWRTSNEILLYSTGNSI